MKSVFLFISLSLFAVPALASELAEEVSCEYGIGSNLCKYLDLTASSFDFNCTGAACYGMWRRQIQEMNRFVSLENRALPYSYQATQELGQLASKLNGKICSQKATGDYNWMVALYNAKVAARDAAVRIQKRTNGLKVRTCTLTLN